MIIIEPLNEAVVSSRPARGVKCWGLDRSRLSCLRGEFLLGQRQADSYCANSYCSYLVVHRPGFSVQGVLSGARHVGMIVVSLSPYLYRPFFAPDLFQRLVEYGKREGIRMEHRQNQSHGALGSQGISQIFRVPTRSPKRNVFPKPDFRKTRARESPGYRTRNSRERAFVGWSNNNFNDLQFICELKRTRSYICQTRNHLSCCDSLKRRLLK